MAFAVPLIAIALAVGAIAGMLSWLDGPSEGLLRIGREQGFLPPFFQRVNRQGIEVRILAARLRRAQPGHARGYKAPALGLLCAAGIAASVAALVIGFIPPAQFGHLNPLAYALFILAGVLAIGVLPPLLLDRLRKPAWKAAGEGSA